MFSNSAVRSQAIESCDGENIFFLIWRNSPQWARASSFFRFVDHAQRRTTVGRTSLDEWSARCRDLYLTTHNRQTSMPPAEFEPTISAGERPQTYALDRAATGTGRGKNVTDLNKRKEQAMLVVHLVLSIVAESHQWILVFITTCCNSSGRTFVRKSR